MLELLKKVFGANKVRNHGANLVRIGKERTAITYRGNESSIDTKNRPPRGRHPCAKCATELACGADRWSLPHPEGL